MPTSLEEISLEQIQRLGNENISANERADILFKNFGYTPEDYFDEDKIAALNLVLLTIKKTEQGLIKEYKGFKLPENLLHITFDYFIEIVNCEFNNESLKGTELLFACFYRKNWSKPFNENEIITTAEWALKQPALCGYLGLLAFYNLFIILKETYPILYNKYDEAVESEDGRKLYDMKVMLTNDDPTKITQVEQLRITKIFEFLEQKKILSLKQKK